MYARYFESQRWKVEVTDMSESSVGGVKEVIALISGDKVFSKLKYESGVHRVQRVPPTETQGRVHTSAVTVAVLPEAEEVDIHVEAKDIRVDTFCSSGPGGQSVNTTYSAIRITHLATNTVVSCQDEKSQIKNKDKAMRVLRSRLYELELDKQNAIIGAERKKMVGSGDRSEKIILSLTAAGRAREFQLVRTFSFKVHGNVAAATPAPRVKYSDEPVAAGPTEYIPPSSITLRREITFSDDLVLSKESEEALLWRDIQGDLVQQLMRRLAAARPQPAKVD